ncbi:MAG TPA: hypothetical protein V6D15_21040 [Oculatellaceae cyanobacterium]|jgi:hypothetical protein
MSLDVLKQEATDKNTSQQRLRELAAINDELAIVVAANPLTESSLLTELLIKNRENKQKNREMQRAIASNPNTPTRWLIGLGARFPEEFFSNPVYNLQIWQDVNFNNLSDAKFLLQFVLASNARTSFLDFAAGICQNNLKRLRNNDRFEDFPLDRQHEINIKRIQNRLGAWLGIYSFEEFWKWRETLIVIASHRNTSRNKLLELSTSNEDIVAQVAHLGLDRPNDDIQFWDKVASYKQPNLILFIPSHLMFKLIQLPDISINFIKAASQLDQYPDLLNIIANHRKTPKDVLEKLAENSIPFVAEAAKLHINYAGEMETGWREQADSKIDRTQLPSLNDNEEGIELRLWHMGAIHESTLPYLNQTSIYETTNTLLKIICDVDTSKATLDYIKNHPKFSQLITECITCLEQRSAILFDVLPRTLPIDTTKLPDNIAVNQIKPVVDDFNDLLLKIDDKYWCKKRKFIFIKDLDIYEFLIIFNQKSIFSHNKKYYLPKMLSDFEGGRYKNHNLRLFEISNLEYYGVILTTHPSTSPQILAKLVEHPSYGVRALVASHHNITQNSLNRLIEDRHPEVRAAALANLKLDSTLKTQLEILENPNLSSLDLLELANSEHTAVRAKVAHHPHVDGSILAKLANDKFIVRLAVARHPKTPSNILTGFTQHPDQKLHLAVAQNPGAPKDLLIKLATQPAPKSGFHFNPLNLAAVKSLLTQEPLSALDLLARCLKFPNKPSFARFLVLMNPQIPNSFLARYYKSWFWLERYAIAQNPNTDEEIRQQLTQDPNRIVRAAARDNLK